MIVVDSRMMLIFLFKAMYCLFSDAFNTEQLLSSMDKLRHGQAVDIPNYDFKSYKNNVFPARRVHFSHSWSLKDMLLAYYFLIWVINFDLETHKAYDTTPFGPMHSNFDYLGYFFTSIYMHSNITKARLASFSHIKAHGLPC